jgi:2-isopropylmalate synthase
MKIEIYDTTLRDGTQGEFVSFTVGEKLQVAGLLDEIGMDFVEGGWPGANPRDSEFFRQAGRLHLKHAKLTAFGSTAHPQGSPENDANLQALLHAETPVVTIFGKSWTLHVEQALGIGLDENLRLVRDSVRYLARRREVIFDAEHFFDGYENNSEYALQVLQAAAEGGARLLVLCDTNGGTLAGRIAEIFAAVRSRVELPLGIHAHNDCDFGTANAVAAVQAGAMHVQGTFNGWGERCGNADLCSILPVLELKLGYETIGGERLRKLAPTARRIAELSGLAHDHRLPFVGRSAFAHKGGIHVSAVRRNPATYEHIAPESVGNTRRVLVSDLSGRSNVLEKAAELGFGERLGADGARDLTAAIKEMENRGYELESADGTLELLVHRRLGTMPDYFTPVAFTVQTQYIEGGAAFDGTAPALPAGERAAGDGARPLQAASGSEARSEAQVTLNVEGRTIVASASDRGPVAALDAALRRALVARYPELASVVLTDYKVRILEGNRGTKAQVRVLVESSDGERSWTTVGVSDNIIEASWEALTSSLQFRIHRERGGSPRAAVGVAH